MKPESRITAKTSSTCNINLNNFLYESILTEPGGEGTLLYIPTLLSYKVRFEHKKNQLELAFIEMIKILKIAPLLLTVFISILI